MGPGFICTVPDITTRICNTMAKNNMFFAFSEKWLLNNECVYLIVANIRKKSNLKKYINIVIRKGTTKDEVCITEKCNVRV